MSIDKFQPEFAQASRAMAARDFFTARRLAEAMIKKGGKSDARVQALYARALQGTGDLDNALKVQRKLIKKLPGEPTLRFACAQMLVQKGRADLAFSELKIAEKLGARQPELLSAVAGAYHALGAAYGETRHYSDALAAFMSLAPRVAEMLPDDAALRLRLGQVLIQCHRHEEAVGHLQAAADVPRMRERAQHLLMRLHMDMGDASTAVSLGRELLDAPNPDGLVYLMMSRADASALTETDVTAMRERMAAPETDAPTRTLIGFALGHHYDKAGAFDTAFSWYVEANKARKVDERTSVTQLLDAFDSVARLYPADDPTPAQTDGAPTARPIFVVGLPRSGTTLVERILNNHPSVVGAGELADIGRIALATEGRAPDDGQVKDMRAAYEEALDFHCPGAERVVDKMPRNFINVGFIHRLYPDAIILHCTRDPMAVCFSNFVTDFVGVTGGDSDLADLGAVYRGYEKLMAHWQNVVPDNRLVDVSYEALVADPETEAKRIVAACGLDWDAACLEFHRNADPVRTASVSQVRQPVYSSSVERWRAYEKHLGPLVEALKD